MRKGSIIILGVLILGLVLLVSLVSINNLQKKESSDDSIEITNDILQSEEDGDTEVEFNDSEQNNQQNQNNNENNNNSYNH